MPLQNRVTPWGEIIAHQARGLFTGNRGVLVDRPHCLVRRRWTSKAWLVCALEFRNWWRPVMQPHTWTELFFLDEAVALAAGHRPCATCRRGRFNEFRDRAAATLNMPKLPALQLDARRHEAARGTNARASGAETDTRGGCRRGAGRHVRAVAR